MAKATEGTEYNWLPIIIIGGLVFFVSQQKGCDFDLKNILPGTKASSNNTKLDIKEPPSEYKNTELAAFQLEVGKNKAKAALLAAFYFAYSDILSRNPEKFTNKEIFRKQHSKALDLAFKNDPALKEPELGTEIEAYLQRFISLDPGPLDVEKTKNCLLALAWGAKNA